MKKITSVLVMVVFLFAFSSTIIAARILPRFKKAGKATTGSYSNITVYPRLRSDRQALIVSFGNLQKAVEVSYLLYYQTNGKDEGVGGSIDPSVGSTNRELLFGTCSSGVCRYHQNISGMKFEVTYQLPSGKKYIKRYKIRV